MSATLLTGASQVVTCTSTEDSVVLADTDVAIDNGEIIEVGARASMRMRYERADVVDCEGQDITPALIDSHTHTVFGGWRAAEYTLRSRGVPYMEIARRGGGINASVASVRGASEDELVDLTRARLQRMLERGTTTVEIKSGYGLQLDAELKQLRAVRRIREEGWNVLPTFLGAHEFPLEYRDDREAYVALVVEQMIPVVAREDLAIFCDVFCEPGVFTPAQTRRILEAGKEHGLIPKLHADEFESSGAAGLAVALGAASADHLGAITDEDIEKIAASDTVATLLPATLLFLGKKEYAPARRLIDAGARVALATDFNPGSSPTSSMPLVMTLACSQMGMDPLEALVAATAGGAAALRLRGGRGTIVQGAPADLVVWDVPDYQEIAYLFGEPPIQSVFRAGKRVFSRL